MAMAKEEQELERILQAVERLLYQHSLQDSRAGEERQSLKQGKYKVNLSTDRLTGYIVILSTGILQLGTYSF